MKSSEQSFEESVIYMPRTRNRFHLLRSWIFLAVMAAAPVVGVCSAVEPLTWGPSAGGLRLGISVNKNRVNSQLEISLENVGTSKQKLLLEAGGGTVFQIEATEQDGMRHALHEDNPLFLVPNFQSQMLVPITKTLGSGATSTVVFPLKKFYYWGKDSKTTLDTILLHGGNFVVVFEVNEKWLKMAHLPTNGFWTGRIGAGPIRVRTAEAPVDLGRSRESGAEGAPRSSSAASEFHPAAMKQAAVD